MSLFNWIFGKKHKPTLNVHVESFESDHSRADESERQSISEIKKESTVVKNEKGYLESVRFVTEYIENNNLHFQSYLSLMKKIIPYMVKAKDYDSKDFIGFMDKYSLKYTELESLDNQIEFGHLYRKFDVKFGIRFFEHCASDLPAPQQGIADHFNLYAKLSEYLLDAKRGDDAMINIRKAILVNTDFEDEFVYLSNWSRIAELHVRLHSEGYKKPNNHEIVFYYAFVIALRCIKDLRWDTGGFIRSKERCRENPKELFGYSDVFQSALKSLADDQKTINFYQEFNNYCFSRLPITLKTESSDWKYNTSEEYWQARTKKREHEDYLREHDFEKYMALKRERFDRRMSQNEDFQSTLVSDDIMNIFDEVKVLVKRVLD